MPGMTLWRRRERNDVSTLAHQKPDNMKWVVRGKRTKWTEIKLTATLLLRQSLHAPNFRIKAARSLEAWDKGPVRLLLVRRMLETETSEPSLREKMDWCRLGEVSALYDVLEVSAEA
jgi:hypothetical protein